MGPPGETYTLPRRKSPEFKKKNPGQQLGLCSVGMTESDNAAALTVKSPPETVKERLVSPKNDPGCSEKSEIIESPQNTQEKNYRFGNFGLRNLHTWGSFNYWYAVRFMHLYIKFYQNYEKNARKMKYLKNDLAGRKSTTSP